jgi:hypothetical protein
MTDKPSKKPKPHAMPYKSLEELAAGEPDICVIVFKELSGQLWEFYDREAVARITGKSIPTLEMWRAKGWLVPVRTWHSRVFYDVQEIHELIETGEFPSQTGRPDK